MNIGFNATSVFTTENLIAGLGKAWFFGAFAAVGCGAAFLTQKAVHKIAVDYFNVESTSRNLAAFELVCGGLVGLGVSVTLACYCPALDTIVSKVTPVNVGALVFIGLNGYMIQKVYKQMN